MYEFEKIAGVKPSVNYLRNPKYKFEKIAAGGPIGYYTSESDNNPYPERMTPSGPVTYYPKKQGPSPAEIRRMEQAAREQSELKSMDVSSKWLLGAKEPYWITDQRSGAKYHLEYGPNNELMAVLDDGTSMPYQQLQNNLTRYGNPNPTSEQIQSGNRSFNKRVHGVDSSESPDSQDIPISNYVQGSINKGRTPESQGTISNQWGNNPQMISLLPQHLQTRAREMQEQGLLPSSSVQPWDINNQLGYSKMQGPYGEDMRRRYQYAGGTQQMNARINAQMAQEAQQREQYRQMQAQIDRRDATRAAEKYTNNQVTPDQWLAMNSTQRGNAINEYNRQQYNQLGAERQKQWNAANGNIDNMADFNAFKKQQLALWGNRWRSNGKSEEDIDTYIRQMYGHRLRDNGVDMSTKVPSSAMANLPRSVRPPMIKSPSTLVTPPTPRPSSVTPKIQIATNSVPAQVQKPN